MDPIIISSSAFYGVTPFTYIVTRISFIPSALGGSLPWSLLPLDTFLLSPEIATHTPYPCTLICTILLLFSTISILLTLSYPIPALFRGWYTYTSLGYILPSF